MNDTPQHTGSGTGIVPKTSVLAVVALALGILGFTVIAGLAGLVLGIVAKIRITRSGGRLTGNGFAWAGIIVSTVWLLLLVVAVVGFALPAFTKMQAGMMANPGGSYGNLRRLGQAVRFYQNDNGGKFPPEEKWCATLRPNLGARADQILRRPGNPPGAECGYGYNAAVAGLTITEVNPETVVIFELETAGCNVSGGEELLRHPSNPRDYVFVITAAGSIKPFASTNLTALRWKP